jgi:hypothetical protein
MFKNSVRVFVENIYKMGCLNGSGVPVLYIGRTVPKSETGLQRLLKHEAEQRVGTQTNKLLVMTYKIYTSCT